MLRLLEMEKDNGIGNLTYMEEYLFSATVSDDGRRIDVYAPQGYLWTCQSYGNLNCDVHFGSGNGSVSVSSNQYEMYMTGDILFFFGGCPDPYVVSYPDASDMLPMYVNADYLDVSNDFVELYGRESEGQFTVMTNDSGNVSVSYDEALISVDPVGDYSYSVRAVSAFTYDFDTTIDISDGKNGHCCVSVNYVFDASDDSTSEQDTQVYAKDEQEGIIHGGTIPSR